MPRSFLDAARQFDVVLSMFGAMFAPRPEVVASETAPRLSRPAAWSPWATGLPKASSEQMFKITSKSRSAATRCTASDAVGSRTSRERSVLLPVLRRIARLETTKQHLLFDYPFPPSEAVAFFRKYFGPTQTSLARLDDAGQRALAADLTSHLTTHNQGDPNHTVIKAEYLEVHASVS